MPGDAHLLSDIRIDLREATLRPVYGVGEERRQVTTRQGPRRIVDFATTDGRDNLGQAVALRLLTPRGELSALAHPEYGSRLHELIGRPNTATTRDLVRLFVLESLQREPRIARIVDLVITARDTGDATVRSLVDVALRVQPADAPAGNVVDLGPFTIAL